MARATRWATRLLGMYLARFRGWLCRRLCADVGRPQRAYLDVLDLEMPLHFHAGELLNLSAAAAARCREQTEAGAEIVDDALAALLLAAAAAEASINEFSATVLLDASRPWDQVAPTLLAAARAVQQMETEGASIVDKYKAAGKALSPGWNGAGQRPLQDLALLIGARNRVVHLRTEARDKANEMAAKVRSAAGVGRSSDLMDRMPWLNRLMVPEVAEWAVRTSAASMLEILELVSADRDEMLARLRFPYDHLCRHAGRAA